MISENQSALQLKEKHAAQKYQNTHQWYLNKQTDKQNIQVLKTSLKAGLELVARAVIQSKRELKIYAAEKLLLLILVKILSAEVSQQA